jgi:hypothetical protein
MKTSSAKTMNSNSGKKSDPPEESPGLEWQGERYRPLLEDAPIGVDRTTPVG